VETGRWRLVETRCWWSGHIVGGVVGWVEVVVVCCCFGGWVELGGTGWLFRGNGWLLSEESEGSNDDDDCGAPILRKHLSRRAKSTATKELPFSPRKSRSRKVMTFTESESDSGDRKPVPTR
jgi:hypothetical protein